MFCDKIFIGSIEVKNYQELHYCSFYIPWGLIELPCSKWVKTLKCINSVTNKQTEMMEKILILNFCVCMKYEPIDKYRATFIRKSRLLAIIHLIACLVCKLYCNTKPRKQKGDFSSGKYMHVVHTFAVINMCVSFANKLFFRQFKQNLS